MWPDPLMTGHVELQKNREKDGEEEGLELGQGVIRERSGLSSRPVLSAIESLEIHPPLVLL
jgi:hypothetical protein